MILTTEETTTKVNIELVEDMTFRWDLGLPKVGECFIDETNHNLDDMIGPNPSRLLASAILGCLSASFIFCLQKRNLELDDLRADAEIIIAKNEKKIKQFYINAVEIRLINSVYRNH